MLPELQQGMQKMKYALNHPWKFEAPNLAIGIGFIQITIVAFVSVISYYIIIFTPIIIEIVKDFLVI